MLQHVLGLGITQGLAMQSSQIVSQSGILALNSGHIGLADNLIAIGNKARID